MGTNDFTGLQVRMLFVYASKGSFKDGPLLVLEELETNAREIATEIRGSSAEQRARTDSKRYIQYILFCRGCPALSACSLVPVSRQGDLDPRVGFLLQAYLDGPSQGRGDDYCYGFCECAVCGKICFDISRFEDAGRPISSEP